MNTDKSQTRVLVAMSGGVDSSAAAALLVEQGYQVTGVTMKIWAGERQAASGLHHGCYGPEEIHDIEDARQVAKTLGIPLHVLDLTREYKTEVLDYFCEQYLSGRTPSPCVRCNQKIKFNALIKKAADSGLSYDFVASGHYARIDRHEQGRYLLRKARDLEKDQTYFLSYLSQSQLSSLLFPLGELLKSEVRKIAARWGMAVAEKPDSQNFISGDYSGLITEGAGPGPILDSDGRVLGQHRGIQFYTIGQRKGLGLSSHTTLYVTRIDAERNAVIVGKKDSIYRREFVVSEPNWIGIEGLHSPMRLKTRIRSTHKEADSTIVPLDEMKLRVTFDEAQLAITPGQVAVFYDGEYVLGGGLISGLSDCAEGQKRV